MELKKGMICKHFKGNDLIEKNIYEIISVSPEYTGEKYIEPVVVYSSIFQNNKTFIREYADLQRELSIEEQEKYHQVYKIVPLTDAELNLIKTEEFINAKMEYLKKKYSNDQIKKTL